MYESPITRADQGDDMKKFIVIGRYSHIIEAESWEAAFWQAWRMLGDRLVSITAVHNLLYTDDSD